MAAEYEIVERLNQFEKVDVGDLPATAHKVMEDAADTIVALAEALDQLVMRLDAYMVRVPNCTYREFYQAQHDDEDSETNRARSALSRLKGDSHAG